MRYWIPRLELAITQPRQARYIDKFGGLPWGLPVHLWPSCGACGSPQTFLVQMEHSAERLELGAPGNVLFGFQCNADPGACSTWDGSSGANRFLILPADALTDGLTPAPAPEVEVECEALVSSWEEKEDGITPEYAANFLDDARLLQDTPEEVLQMAPMCTRVGSVPAWIQSAEDYPGAPWVFVAQLDSQHRFEGSPPPLRGIPGLTPPWWRIDAKKVAPGQNGAPHAVDVRESGWDTHAATYGSMGAAYLFVRTDGAEPQAFMLWQC